MEYQLNVSSSRVQPSYQSPNFDIISRVCLKYSFYITVV